MPNEILNEVTLWETMLYYMYSCVIFAYSMQFSQLEVTDIYYRGIYEHKRSLPNDGHLKIKFETFNIRVDFLKNFIFNPKINFNFISEVSRS